MNGMTIGEMLRACRGEWQGTEETLTKAPSSIVTEVSHEHDFIMDSDRNEYWI